MDYGRWALIISDKTDSLKRIPELTAAQNVHKEFREFTMAEYGMANIVEIDEDSGPSDADNRDYYSGDGKEIRESSEKYVKDMYLADSLTSLDHNDLSDLSKPARVKFVTKGKRGGTDLTSATMAIRVEGLFDNFPNYFETSKKQEKAKESEDSEKQKPRTADWLITPFTSEWRYKILAPAGFKLRAIPPDKNLKDGGLTFTEHYSSNPEGTVVEAVLRVENTNARLTVQQAEALRDVVVKERSVDPIFITFDHLGHSLLAAGKIKEGLAAYQQIVAQHPKDAIHKSQFAHALLTAGLGEEARKVAKEATTLDPNSAVAYSTLGNVLKHDLIGRLLKKGMDFDGAVSAYKKSIALDPKETDTRANLALMLEYNTEGVRYGDRAPLKEAVQVLRDLKKLDEDYERTYEDNILYDLWYAHDYQGVLDYASTLPTNPTRKGLTLGAIAALQGSDAALKKSLEITTDDHERSNALVNAGNALLRVRKYQECAALIAAGAHGQNNEAQVARSAAIYAKTKPYEEIKFEPTDPRGVVHKVMGDLLGGKFTQEEGKSLIYDFSSTIDEKQYKQMMTLLKLQLGATGLPLTTIADMAMSNMHYSVDGDDSVGYKIILEGAGAPPQNLYVVREGNQYQIAAFSSTTQTSVEQFAPFILQDIEKNNLTGARKWLDRARDEIHMSSGDDPLSGQLFPYFWTRGQEADASVMRTAALVLLESKEAKGPHLSALLQARDAAKSDADRNRLTLVIASAYGAQEKWAEMLEPAEQLMKAIPSSVRAFNLAVTAYKNLGQYDKWEKVVQERSAKYPDELDYVRSSSELAAYRGQFEKSREIIKSLLDKGQGTGGDMNQYAWYALLLPGPVDQESLDYAQRANDLTKNNSFAILHTLACLDAAAGKTGQAHELLLKAMDALHIEEPNSAIWFGLASIAEQYGVVDAATTMYGRVEKPKVDYPGTSYAIAQRHIAALTGKANVVAKSGDNKNHI
jgi:tetratricopeptide (TPR) repeat protein